MNGMNRKEFYRGIVQKILRHKKLRIILLSGIGAYLFAAGFTMRSAGFDDKYVLHTEPLSVGVGAMALVSAFLLYKTPFDE
jgi:hypothetical protein